MNYEDGVISAITGAQPAKKIVADRNFVQSNPEKANEWGRLYIDSLALMGALHFKPRAHSG